MLIDIPIRTISPFDTANIRIMTTDDDPQVYAIITSKSGSINHEHIKATLGLDIHVMKYRMEAADNEKEKEEYGLAMAVLEELKNTGIALTSVH